MDEAETGAAAPPPEPIAAPSTPPLRTRRWVLAGAGAAIVGGGAGVLGGLARDRDVARPRPNPPPEVLVAAAAAERQLVADLDATTGGAFVIRQVISAARADHVAHLGVLRALLARYDPVSSGPSSGSTSGSASRTTPKGTPRTRAQLRTAERQAATDAARRAAAVGGALGALLASVSACETAHAELFG